MGQLPQRAGSLVLNGGGTATAVPPAVIYSTQQHAAVNCHLSSVVGHSNLVSILLKVMYYWDSKHVDDSNGEWLHERLTNISLIVEQTL